MNHLCQKFQDKLAVLAFPSNQFGHQENNNNEELLDILRHIRPGNGFQPLMEIFQKIQVNGRNEDPLFTFLKKSLPAPYDNPVNSYEYIFIFLLSCFRSL